MMWIKMLKMKRDSQNVSPKIVSPIFNQKAFKIAVKATVPGFQIVSAQNDFF